jgi:polyisoprenoid-binding protein YceI
VAVAGAVVLVAAGWYLFIRSDAPPPVSLEAAVDQATSTTASTAPAVDTTATTGAAPSTTAAAAVTQPPAAGADGVWVVDADGSFVGYRVVEELSGIGTAEAVGRTSQLVGGMTIEGSNATAVSLEVDMTTLESDRSQRDGQLETRGLETDSFPTATFVLTEPMDLGGEPQIGEALSATAVGDLTLHGVTRRVGIAMEAEWVDEGTIVVIGSVDLLITDYEIEAPVGFRVLSINEIGTIEMQLVFVR